MSQESGLDCPQKCSQLVSGHQFMSILHFGGSVNRWVELWRVSAGFIQMQGVLQRKSLLHQLWPSYQMLIFLITCRITVRVLIFFFCSCVSLRQTVQTKPEPLRRRVTVGQRREQLLRPGLFWKCVFQGLGLLFLYCFVCFCFVQQSQLAWLFRFQF